MRCVCVCDIQLQIIIRLNEIETIKNLSFIDHKNMDGVMKYILTHFVEIIQVGCSANTIKGHINISKAGGGGEMRPLRKQSNRNAFEVTSFKPIFEIKWKQIVDLGCQR